MSLLHPLRPSVMRTDEWYKERDQAAWRQIRKQVLERDRYTCAYCLLVCQKFMQVNHIGAEDNHNLENLETVCAACHRVLHLTPCRYLCNGEQVVLYRKDECVFPGIG